MRTTARGTAIALAAILVSAGALWAHDMFLRPERHFVAADSRVFVRLLNGTFSRSENSITRDRLIDVAIVSPAGRAALDTAQWSARGDTSTFTFQSGSAGTYVLGVSTKPRVLGLSAAEFNTYLEDDGIPDELEARRREGRLDEPSRERYHKHVKALVQVGDAPGPAFSTVLGYPAEIVALDNPYARKPGDTLRLRLLVKGQPAPRQFVQYGGRSDAGARIAPRDVRSGADGVARIPMGRRGTYYVKFIHMQRLTGDAEANYESAWATLTFGVR